MFREHRLLFLPGEQGWDQEGEATGRAGSLGAPWTLSDALGGRPQQEQGFDVKAVLHGTQPTGPQG